MADMGRASCDGIAAAPEPIPRPNPMVLVLSLWPTQFSADNRTIARSGAPASTLELTRAYSELTEALAVDASIVSA